MKKRNLCVAGYFERLDSPNLGFPVYLSSQMILGYLLEDNTFMNILTGEKIISLDVALAGDLPWGYDMIKPVKDLKHKGEFKGEGIRKYYRDEIEQMVYFYDGNERILVSTIKDFEKGTNVKLHTVNVEEFNASLDKLIKGEVEAEEYLKEIGDILEDEEESVAEEVSIPVKPISEVIENVKKRVVSQDEAVKKLVISIYKNLIFPNMKSNVLICGPTGCGKTELIRSIAHEFDVPVSIEDMTRFTETGYVGASADDILINLIHNADGDVRRAERSILFLDEIDKKASTDKTKLDFNKGDFLKSLLKIIEGGKFDLNLGGGLVTFDTSKLIVIAGGAFSDLYENKKEMPKVGFEQQAKPVKTSKDLTVGDLEKYGMPIEFLGRFKSIIKMNTLSEKDFVSILKTSEVSSLREYIKLFEEKGIKLVIPESMYERIAHLAVKYKTGARALNIVVDNVFEDILYEIFENIENIDEIVLGENICENKSDFTLKRKAIING